MTEQTGTISTSFQVGIEKTEWHDMSMAAGWKMVGLFTLGGIVAGSMIHPLAMVITVPLAWIASGLFVVIRGATAPKQSIETLLTCDGETVAAYNRRLPPRADSKLKPLFSVRLSEIDRVESGRALDLFGGDIPLGDYKAVPYQMVGNANAVQHREKVAQGTTAIYLKCRRGLHLIFAENMTSALAFQLVGQLHDFLDEARAMGSETVSAPLGVADAPRAAGFDL